jgi:ubiquinone/menaquinone biosynthesis C-methylase UbiE
MPTSSNSALISQGYWNAAAENYAQAFTDTFVGKMWRDAVWRELDTGFEPGARVLELNCGTGIDAIHLAHSGISVLACDISSRMIELARQRAAATSVSGLLDFRVLPTEQLATLESEAAFDGAFSNFSGLNCVQDLIEVRRNLARLLKPGSRVFLCMLGKFAPWEKLWYLAHADWKNAFRTFQSSRETSAQGEVKVQYPSRKKIVELFEPEFTLRKWKGIGIAVPPSYMERWAIRFSKITECLNTVDQVIGNIPVLRSFGGCLLFEFERTATSEESRRSSDTAS